MQGFLLTTQFILAIIITIAVLLQKSSSIGLGAYSGSNESMFGAKGPNAFMAKFTFVLGAIFVANTIALGYVYNKSLKSSIAEDIKVEKSIVPSVPKVPTTSQQPKAPNAPSTSN
jgi:preprotein translocase subunit SecG